MKKKKNGTFLFIGIVSLIVVFIILLAIINKEKPVDEVLSEVFSGTDVNLVYISRPGCSWCQKQKPILTRTAKNNNFKYSYINTDKLDLEKLTSVLERFNIDIDDFGTPTFVVIKNGKVTGSNIGYMDETKLTAFLQNLEVIK